MNRRIDKAAQTRRDTVVALLERGPATSDEIRRALKLTPPEAYGLTARLVKRGLIVRVTAGVFRLAETDVSAADVEEVRRALSAQRKPFNAVLRRVPVQQAEAKAAASSLDDTVARGKEQLAEALRARKARRDLLASKL